MIANIDNDPLWGAILLFGAGIVDCILGVVMTRWGVTYAKKISK